METTKPLHDYTDEELRDAIGNAAARVQYSYENYRQEIERRSQDRHTTALNRWITLIIIATVVNTIAAAVQALAALGLSRGLSHFFALLVD